MRMHASQSAAIFLLGKYDPAYEPYIRHLSLRILCESEYQANPLPEVPPAGALLLPASKKPASYMRRGGRRASLSGIADAGRWSLIRKPATNAGIDQPGIEHVARVLLRRYGVVCWRLLEREAAWLPPCRASAQTVSP